MDPENPGAHDDIDAPKAAAGGGQTTSPRTGRNAAVGIAAGAGAAAGFSLEAIDKLNLGTLVADHTAYSVGLLALVLAFILVTGRATLSIPDATSKAIGHMTAFCAVVAVAALGFFFLSNTTVIHVRYATNAGKTLDEAHLLRLLDNQNTYEMIGGDTATPVLVDKTSVEIDVGALYAAYNAAKADAKTQGQNAVTAEKLYQAAVGTTQRAPKTPAS